jgi:hypothetical protein
MAAGDGLLAHLSGAPVAARARALARVQRGTGNALLARHIASMTLQRAQPDAAPPDAAPDVPAAAPSEPVALQQGNAAPAPAPAPAPASASAAAGNRPALTTTTKNCDDCNAAAAILTSGYVGEADVRVKGEGIGNITATKTKSGWSASVGVKWSIDATASTMEITDVVWPNMTAADRVAVASFRAALLAHEEGHFTVVEATIAKLPTTIAATGATEQAAIDAVKAKAPTEMANGQTAIDNAKDTYEAKTNHGKTQSAVGGTNVKLTCPPTAPAPSPAPAPAPKP